MFQEGGTVAYRFGSRNRNALTLAFNMYVKANKRTKNITLNLVLFTSFPSMLGYIFDIFLKFLEGARRCDDYI